MITTKTRAVPAFKNYATRMLPGGYSPVAILPGTKRPLGNNWEQLRDRPLHAGQIHNLVARHPDLGIGVCGGYMDLVPIDIDTENPAIIDIVTSVLPKATVAKAGLRGFTVFYRGKVKARKYRGHDGMLAEVITTGQTVLPPTMHPGKPEEGIAPRPYRWLTEATLYNTRVEQLPTITEADLERLEQALVPHMPARREYVAPAADAPPVSDKRMRAYALRALEAQAGKVAAAGKGMRNDALFNAACCLGRYQHHKVLGEKELEGALMAACQANGLIADDTEAQCLKTLAKGLLASKSDALPALADRPRGTPQGNCRPLAAL